MEIVRITASTDGTGQRVGCGITSLLAALATWYARSSGEFGAWVAAALCAIVAGSLLFRILEPTHFEFVVESNSLRFGPVGRCRTLLRSDIRELRFETGTDQDLAAAIMKNGSVVSISTQIIGTTHGDLAERLAEAWPEVEIWLRAVPMTFPRRK